MGLWFTNFMKKVVEANEKKMKKNKNKKKTSFE